MVDGTPGPSYGLILNTVRFDGAEGLHYIAFKNDKACLVSQRLQQHDAANASTASYLAALTAGQQLPPRPAYPGS